MGRVDVHNHFLPGIDDGCRDLEESLTSLRMLAAHGYDRVFCTPHTGDTSFHDLTTAEVAARVADLRTHIAREKIAIELRPGGELRLSPDLPELAREVGIPTFGHASRVVLADIWEADWPAWATRAVEWLQSQDYQVILAHPERMPYLIRDHARIDDLARLGLRFQGNLGPIAGNDSSLVAALAERYLKDGRYFMVATDGHRPNTLPQRLAGLARIEALVGSEALKTLTETHPATLWN